MLPGLIPLYAAHAIAFTKSDGFLYASSNTGTFGSSVKLISTKIDTGSTTNIGRWLLFNDSASQLTRISNVDGSKVDEPLSECNALSSCAPTMDPLNTILWIPNAYCSGPQYDILQFPVTTLP